MENLPIVQRLEHWALGCTDSYEGDALKACFTEAADTIAELVEALGLIAEATQRQQLPITALVHTLATDALTRIKEPKT